MERHGLTSESRLRIHYVLARAKFESNTLTAVEDWVLGIAAVPFRSGGGSVAIGCAQSDGTCRMFGSRQPEAGPLTLDPSDAAMATRLSQYALTGVCARALGDW